MKVSIIVPVYNTEPYIVRCFESIANQTYTNIECLFVDDCTPDNSVGIIEQLMAQYSGSVVFRIVKHEVNRGLSVVEIVARWLLVANIFITWIVMMR